jgi:predicted  nucleic acid-binding Zn-ribbon protein
VLRRVVPTKADVSDFGSTIASDDLVGTILTIKRRELTLEERLAELSDLMGRSSTLVEQVSAELEARAATAQRLRDEAKQAEELASINREQAEAIRRLMDAELAAKLTENGAAIRKDVRKDTIRVGVGSFVAGGGLTLLITLLVHPLH